MLETGYCAFYGKEETIEHVLLLCNWSEYVWYGALGFKIDAEGIITIDEWLLRIFELKNLKGELRIERRQRVTFLLWYL